MPYLPRDLEAELLRLWENKRFFIIEGPRRSGKTTLLKRINELKGGTYISFEDPRERVDFLRDPIRYVRTWKDDVLYLDEIQYLGEEGSRAMKLIYDKTDVRIIASGSGAFGVKMKLKAYLVGRAYFKVLFPLSFGEFVRWKSPNLYRLYIEGHRAVERLLEGDTTSLPLPSQRLEALFEDYSTYGGFPEVVLKGKEELMQITNTLVEEDILHYFSRLDSYKVWNVVRRLAALSGGLLTYSSLGVSEKTGERYLSIFTYSHLIHLIPPYFTNPLKELSKMPKVVFLDIGVRNALIGNLTHLSLRPDRGEIMESVIARQLIDRNLRYWRSKNKAEVDLVILGRFPLPIEVKYGRPRFTKSFMSFINRYNPPIGIIVGKEVKVEKRGNAEIVSVPPYYF